MVLSDRNKDTHSADSEAKRPMPTVERRLTKSIHSRLEQIREAESMNDNDRASEVLSPIQVDRREACDRRRFIVGASAALAAVALSSRPTAAQIFRKLLKPNPGRARAIQDQNFISTMRQNGH